MGGETSSEMMFFVARPGQKVNAGSIEPGLE
jgi:hypothetical protein